MLESMLRFQVEVSDEDEHPLRVVAVKEHRSVREQASFLLHLKIRELAAHVADEQQTQTQVA